MYIALSLPGLLLTYAEGQGSQHCGQVAKPRPVMVNSLKILTITNECCRVHLKFFGRLALRR